MDNVFCTVFTPAYNRKELIIRLYESLKTQSLKDFEWVIIDDGSTDGTDEAISAIEEDSFSIIYKKVENGGKHRAINKGLDLAHGQVFAIVDSDDYLTEDAIEKIKVYFDDIKNSDKKFAGVAGLKCFSINDSVGTSFEGYSIDAKSTERKKYNINGDKFEVFYTNVLKQFKFPEIDGEKFMTEAISWNRMSYDGYYIRWFNDNIYICNYLEAGLTDSKDRLVRQNPKGYAMFIKECVQHNILSLKEKMGYYSYYYKVCKADMKLGTVAKELNTSPLIVILAYIIRLIIGR